MSEQSNNKAVRIGKVLKKKKDGSFFIVLGAENQKDSKFNRTVEITVKDSAGKVISTQTNGFVTMKEPTNENAPEALQYDLLIGSSATS